MARQDTSRNSRRNLGFDNHAWHAWRGEKDAGEYADIAGFCKSASMDEIRKHGHVLTPGRHVDATEVEDDSEPFKEKMLRLSAQWRGQRAEAAIDANLKNPGYGA